MTLHERIESGEFNGKIKYPDAEHPDMRKIAAEICELGARLVRLKAQKDGIRRNLIHEYDKSASEGVMRFRRALEDEFRMVGHPKADAVWAKAWEDGHSSGLREVLSMYMDLVELVK